MGTSMSSIAVETGRAGLGSSLALQLVRRWNPGRCVKVFCCVRHYRRLVSRSIQRSNDAIRRGVRLLWPGGEGRGLGRRDLEDVAAGIDDVQGTLVAVVLFPERRARGREARSPRLPHRPDDATGTSAGKSRRASAAAAASNLPSVV
jgi:hypothetical protein